MSKRRGNSEGSVYKDKDGRWRASVHLGYSGGRRVRKLLSGRTRAEVARKLTAALRAAEMGIAATSERQTVAQWLQHWLEHVVTPNVRPKTLRTYSDIVKHHLEPELGKRPLVKLSPQDVRRFMKRKTNEGLSPKTVKHLRNTLRAALSVAVEDGLILRNVAAMVKPPRAENREMTAYTPEQAHQFLEAVRGHRLEALFSVALSLGLRQGRNIGTWMGLLGLGGQTTHGALSASAARREVDPRRTEDRA